MPPNILHAPTGLACLAALCLCGIPSGASADPATALQTFDVVIRPETGPSGRVQSLLVTETIVRSDTSAPFVVSAPLSLAGIVPIATTMTEVRMFGPEGELEVRAEDRVEGEEGATRRWTAQTSAGQRVTVRYRTSVPPASGRGPPYPVVAAGRGLAGNTMTLIAIPEAFEATRSTLRWDLAELPAGSVGVATGGEGDLTIEGPPATLLDRWILAGPAETSRAVAGNGFSAFAVGTPPFAARDVMDWSRSAYDTLAQAYGYLGAPPYQLLIRALEGPSFGTGTAANAGGGSLISVGDAFWTGQDEASIKAIIFHEMGHQWVGRLEGDGGLWLAEGLNVYITATLPCEAGLTPWAACAAEISRNAKDYYLSPGRNWSQAAVEATGMGREDVRRVSYGRGMLYFADLDADIRRRSADGRTLLQALRPLFEARHAGRGITLAAWESFLRNEVGPAAVDKFRRIVLDGVETITPAEDAFGPRLRRVPAEWEVEDMTVPWYRWEAVEAGASTGTEVNFIPHASSPTPDTGASNSPLTESTFDDAMTQISQTMHAGMMLRPTGDADRDFAALMIAHHQGAVDMARVELAHGRSETMRRLAQGIIVEQSQEIAVLRDFMARTASNTVPAESPVPSPDHTGH